jgi:2-C-methyl-D-erythritol 4-phosphate cytidylyltransferase/2-C-methyl-D-erythritol 2,4-cyclodiphosphate synthase
MTTRLPELAAIVPAAGSGERLAIGKSKLLLTLAGEPIITHSLRTLELSPRVGEIIVVVGPRAKSITTAIAKSGFRKAKVLAVGGKSRQESVFNGLLQLNPAFKFILIHDGARPFLSPELLNLCIEGGLSFGAAAAAIPVTDTIKRAGDRGLVVETLDRSRLWQVQTPQVFRRELILEAHRQAQEAGNNSSTDDASLVERLGVPVKLVIGDPINIKITRQADLLFAEALAAQRSPQQVVRSEDKHARGARLPSGYPPDLHTGFGYDVHPLGKGRRLVLGGVRINHPLGLLGHSDGDVVTHAICDALLGAASLGDIGQHFPDKDEKYRGISSLVLLRDVAQKLAERGYYVKNIDVTVVAEEPKLASFRSQMEAKLARAVQVPVECVNVKATTTEGLGFAGRGEGIACYATALIYKKSV